MIKRIHIIILAVILPVVILNFSLVVLAQENWTDEIIVRPQIKYKSGSLRDPFVSVVTKIETKEIYDNQGAIALEQPKVDLDKLVVQGIIWGGKMPQAIINNKVLMVGDFIEEVEILSIDKKGIMLNSGQEIVNLSAPGLKKDLKEKTKEE